MVTSIIKWLLFIPALLIIISIGVSLVGDSHCVINKQNKTVRFHMAGKILDIPTQYLDVCKNREGQLAIMDLTWPEFKKKRDFNNKNRESLIRKRLMIGVTARPDYLEQKEFINLPEKSLERMLKQKDYTTGINLYGEKPVSHKNGMLLYEVLNPSSNKPLNQDIYILRNESNELEILLTCSRRAVGGISCSNDQHSNFNDIHITYSFDATHLNDAIKIDRQVAEFIKNMMVEETPLESAE